jgi:hypothetical protein
MKKGSLKAPPTDALLTNVDESKLLPWQASLILKVLFPNPGTTPPLIDIVHDLYHHNTKNHYRNYK